MTVPGSLRAGGGDSRPAAAARLLGGAAVVTALLAGCAGTPRAPTPGAEAAPQSPSTWPATDGPPANPPPDLALTPDAEPRIEALRSSGPNKPYEVLGQRYTPQLADEPFEQTGLASWYGRKFHGRRTASGEVYDMYAMTAAHRTLPIPSYALVRNPRNGREVVVRINDRGPFEQRMVIDLSYAAAVKLGVERGVAPVQLRRLTHDEIRTGRWREATNVASAGRDRPAAPAEAVAPAAPTPDRAPAPQTPGVATAPGVAASSASEPPAAEAAPAAPGSAKAAPVAAAAVESLDLPPAVATQPRSGFWLQFGAFSRREGAVDLKQQLMRELDWLAHALTVFDESSLWRVQAGPYASRTEALGAAQRARAAVVGLQPLILQRR